jgi:hypothetical protein
MGLGDTFEFDEAKYAAKIQDWDIAHLQNQEINKNRQTLSASAGIGGGIGLAPFTGGVSLFGSVYAGRRLSVADQKLKLIQAELNKRGIELHEVTGKDVIVGVAPTICTLGLGVGADALATHATSTVAAHAVAQHGSTAVHEAIQSPGVFMKGLEQGIGLHGHEAGQLLALHGGLQHASAIANFDSSYLVAGAPYVDPAQMAGVAAGMGIAQGIETTAVKKITDFASRKVAVRLVDVASNKSSQPITFARPGDSCRRVECPPQTLFCDHCLGGIDCERMSYFR